VPLRRSHGSAEARSNGSRLGETARSLSTDWWDSWLVEILVTIILSFAGLYISTLNLQHETKIPIELMLGFIEVTFVSFRMFDRRLTIVVSELHDSMAGIFRSAVQHIPQDKLSNVSELWLSRKRDYLLAYAHELAMNHAIDFKKEGAYREVIELTDAVCEGRLGDIVAISSMRITDFEKEPLAQGYFEANRRARRNGVVIRRLFILSPEDLLDGSIRPIMERHAVELKSSDGEEGVKWMLKRDAGNHQSEDFALFASTTVVRQLLNGDFNFSEVAIVVKERRQIFDELWRNPSAKTIDELASLDVPNT